VITFFSFARSAPALGGGCTQYVDSRSLGHVSFVADRPSGNAILPAAGPAGLSPLTIDFQAISLVTGARARQLQPEQRHRRPIGFTSCRETVRPN